MTWSLAFLTGDPQNSSVDRASSSGYSVDHARVAYPVCSPVSSPYLMILTFKGMLGGVAFVERFSHDDEAPRSGISVLAAAP